MLTPDVVDDLYDRFVAGLDLELRPHARELPRTLGLVGASVPWSQVFGHEVTLLAPALFAEAMPDVDEAVVRDAVLAQTCAAIEAFGTDRIEDRQVRPTRELRAILTALQRTRDAAVRRVWPSHDPDCDPASAHAATIAAIAAERRVYQERRTVDFETYESISLGKQSVGFPPTLALTRAAGWDDGRRSAARRVLTSIWLALQMPDDAVDWEDDLERGGAWAVAVAGAAQLRGTAVRDRIWESGVLHRMLARAAFHYERVATLGAELGARRLADWGAARGKEAREMATNEARAPGYAQRAHALIAWRREVLAQ